MRSHWRAEATILISCCGDLGQQAVVVQVCVLYCGGNLKSGTKLFSDIFVLSTCITPNTRGVHCSSNSG